LDTGDALIGGGLLGDKTRGQVIVSGMNLMGYDAMALGPMELSLGLEELQRRIEEASFPLLSANAVVSGTGELVAKPYAVLEVADHRVGIIGLSRQPAEPLMDINVLDPFWAATGYVQEVRERAGTIVVLTSMGYRRAVDLARSVPDIDLVIAARPGQLPRQPLRVPETGALVVTAEQALPRHSGRRVGRLAVVLGADGSLGDASWVSVPMDRTLADDPLMKALLDEHRQ
jgi:2',3'-cyclic-nucleotide 2'-phosphodiesterase (5'-nucleotidase family)